MNTLVRGLFVEGTMPYPPSVVNTSCSVNWSQLQATPGGALIPRNPIDLWLAAGHTGAVRLYFGRGPGIIQPPAWALDLGRVTVYDPVDGKTSTVTRWWQHDVQQAQADLVTRLAAAYDGQIPLIFIANGGTTYAEPFIRGITDARTRAALLNAGYTPALDRASYEAGYEMFRAFKATRLAQAFNPWQYIDPATGNAKVETSFTVAMMDRMAAIWPKRAVWQNNSIRDYTLSPEYATMYDHMAAQHKATGRPIRFQTATKDRIGNWRVTLAWAVAMGAHAVELSPGFQTGLTPLELAQYDAALRAAR